MSDKRQRIVDAALRTLVERGYEAASVKDIADAADVAPGLVHYYFETKDDLLAAAVRCSCDAKRAELESKGPAEAAWQGLQQLKQPGCTDAHLLFVELIGLGLHNSRIASAIRDLIRTDREFIEGLAAQLAPERSEAERGAAAAATWAGIMGIAVLKLFDPDLDLEATVDAFTEMVLSPVGAAAGRKED